MRRGSLHIIADIEFYPIAPKFFGFPAARVFRLSIWTGDPNMGGPAEFHQLSGEIEIGKKATVEMLIAHDDEHFPTISLGEVFYFGPRDNPFGTGTVVKRLDKEESSW